MPLWSLIVIGVGAALLVGGIVLGAILWWRWLVRTRLLRLVSSKEAVDALRKALQDVISSLAEGTDQQLYAFTYDADSPDRRSLHEIASRARLVVDELDAMPLPKRLVPAAEALGDSAYEIARQAGKVHDDCIGDSALQALGSIELERVSETYGRALKAVEQACEQCGLEDSAVYGGGMYL